MKFNEKLTKLRKMEGLSQEELGYRLNVTRQTVSKWELGQTTPEMDKLIEIGKIFKISVDDLLNDSEVQSAKTVINENNIELKEEKIQETINEETVSNDTLNKKSITDEKYVPKENNNRDIFIMLILGTLFVITLALFIAKGYEMVSAKFEELNPKDAIKQVENDYKDKNETNNVTNEIQDEINTNLVNEVDETNTISQSDKTNSGEELNQNSTDKSDVSTTTQSQGTTSSREQSSSSTTTQNQETTSSTGQSSSSSTTQNQGTTSSTGQQSTTDQMFENFSKDFEIKSFNGVIEMYAGSSNGFHVKSLLDQVITKNKTGARKITVNTCGVETQDETTIRNLKGNFGDFDNWEVILSYDGEGFVNKVIIQK